MTIEEKFLSDVARIRKHEWQTKNCCTYVSISRDLRRLFENASLCPGELAGSLYDYWENHYSALFDASSEESSDVLEKLAAMLSFLNKGTEYEEKLNQDDWTEIGRLTGYEAEDMPLDFLQDLMAVLVKHNAY